MGSIPDRREYLPRQVGPHIYDGDGNLIWSGASVDENMNVFDFRVYQEGNRSLISYILNPDRAANRSVSKSAHVLMDDTYNKTTVIPSYLDWGANEHEFQVFDGGRKALLVAYRWEKLNITDPAAGLVLAKRFRDNCLLEIDTATAAKDFEWCPSDHGFGPDDSAGKYGEDYIHVNSIDRFANGDLLFSARHTNTISKVSRRESALAWRLGGKKTNFVADFNFTAQHDAKIVSENATVTVITFLDNASDDNWQQRNSAQSSSAMMVALYTAEQPMRAKLLKQWVRPDGKLTTFRGNVQTLPSGNVFTGWSHQGYLSEFTNNGKLVLEAKWNSVRFGTYRAYKFPFIGRPTKLPALKTARHVAEQGGVTVAYVSWNGATEVASWKFTGVAADTNVVVEMGTRARTGFETVLTVAGIWKNITATALDRSGNVLGASATVDTDTVSNKSSTPFVSQTNTVQHLMQALVQNQSIVPMSRSSVWTVILGTILLTVVTQSLLLAAICLYRRFKSRYSRMSDKEVPADMNMPLLETVVSQSYSPLDGKSEEAVTDSAGYSKRP
ncbi:hypothetical protein MBLNU457_2215t1 [Dothideomycetes sp. NU457]